MSSHNCQTNHLTIALKFTLKWEGGLSNHPADLGGLTNYGITQQTYSVWKGRKQNCVSQISLEEAKQLYWEEYWLKAGCDQLILPLAIVHFDTAVNFGVKGSIKFLQEAIGGLTIDGIFGLNTQAALLEKNTFKTAELIVKNRIKYRHKRVQQNPSQRVFIEGWLNRDNDLLNFISNLTSSIPKSIPKSTQNSTQNYIKMLTLRTIQPTILKLKPIQSTDLQDCEKLSVQERVFSINSYEHIRKHIRVSVDEDKEPFQGKPIWYVFDEHCEIYDENTRVYPKVYPTQFKLEVPFKPQTDNEFNPTGSCNVTSIAMCLKYFNAPRKPEYSHITQFEDELYKYALDNNYSRHSPYDLAKIVRDYGCQDRFSDIALMFEVREWISSGNPVVIHGYLTSYGHIIVGVGYDETGLIVHDPYGEWFKTGYRTDLSGAFLHYSYQLIEKACIPDGNFWVHFISR